MNSLTKEQSEFLIKKLEVAYHNSEYALLHFTDCRAIIESCTEKEFPAFKINLLDSSQVTIAQDQVQRSLLYINVVNEYGYFDKEEFKQFTTGCNKIVEWLEGQE